jgi:uncharacterized membrane protein YgcG
MLHLLVSVALAGSRIIQNDNFTGSGTVNSAVSFAEYEGAAVLFTFDGGYPLKVIGVDVLSVTYNQGASGQIGAYQFDLWNESGGLVDPPRRIDGGFYPRQYQDFVQFTTASTQFNRITVSPPMIVDAGRVFVSIGQQTSTSMDSTTIAIDTAPLVPGANWYRSMFGTFVPLELPDGGFFMGINHNWIVRLVVEAPDVTPMVTSVFPNAGVNTMPTAVVISGTDFDLAAKAFVGTTQLNVTARSGSTSLSATVPAGLQPRAYDVRVENVPTASGTLPNGFTVLQADGGSGTGGGAGGGAGGGSGGSGGSGGTGGGSGSATLRLDDVTPNDGYNEELTKVVLTGDGFADGAQVLIGPEVLDVVTVKSAAVINAEVPKGIAAGVYDVTIINLDGKRVTLTDGFTVRAGVRTRQGCGCGAAGIEAVLLLICPFTLSRRRRRRVEGHASIS